MAVRNIKLANELIQQWQIEDSGLPLDVEVCPSRLTHNIMDVLMRDSMMAALCTTLGCSYYFTPYLSSISLLEENISAV